MADAKVLPMHDRMGELRARFAAQMGTLLEVVQRAWAAHSVATAGEAAQEIETLYGAVHRITGSAGSFGYADVSRAGAPLEALLASLRGSQGPLASEQRDQISTFIELLIRAWELGEVQPLVRAPEDGAGTDDQLVYLLDGDDAVTGHIIQQLGQFGYRVRRFTDVATMARTLKQVRPAAIIADQILCPEALSDSVHLEDLAGTVPVVLLTDRTDIDTRLQAVQLGCAACLVKPMETNDLLEWLDYFSHRCQREPYRILIVDDDALLADSYALVLQLAGMETEVLTHPLDILDVLTDYKPDLVLMDVYMPECSGLELAQVVRQHRVFLGIPIVFLSVESNINRQLAAKRLGADDFLTKPIEPGHLVAAVSSRAGRARDLRSVMESDRLTGLLNHVSLKERLGVEMKRARRQGSTLSLALVDLDHFKNVNDCHGHLAGDRVLKTLANLLKQRLRQTDVIGRYGGEEFAVILTDTAVKPAGEVMDGLRRSFAQVEHACGGAHFNVTLSCGLAGYDGRADVDALIARADAALYAAKARGRDCVVQATAVAAA